MDVTDEAEMFLQHALVIPWGFRRSSLSSHLHRTPVPYLSLSSPLQELKADGAATPGKSGFFKRLQLPRKLRAFKVSSPHLAAYMGTGGC